MISTHILDTGLGSPATDVHVNLEKQNGEGWTSLGDHKTNSDGRINFDCAYEAGVYRLTFAIEDYFKRNQKESFFLSVPIVFKIEDTERKYHVPLLLNSFGLSVYRGS